MAKLTKQQFEDLFRDEILRGVAEEYERDGVPDRPARREAWNNSVDAYIRDRTLPEAAGNWTHPRWLETYRPSPRRTHATKSRQTRSQHGSASGTRKSPAQLDREIAHATGIGTWRKSDQPWDSEHLDVGNLGARVKPAAGRGYEWSIWVGPAGRRVLHNSGETRTRVAAKQAAQRKLAALTTPAKAHAIRRPTASTEYRVTSIEGENLYGVRVPHGAGVWFLGTVDDMPTVKVGDVIRLFDEARPSHAAKKSTTHPSAPSDWTVRQMTSGRRVVEKARGNKIARIFQGEGHWTVTLNHREPRSPFETTGEIARQSARTLAAAKSVGTKMLNRA